MDITLDNLLPLPFKNRVFTSGLWQKKLHFPKGTKVQIRAPSAQGKTTFLSILYGIRYDYSGEIRFNRRDSRSLTPKEWAAFRQREFSIVFQDLRLFNNFTAYENILVNAHLTGPADNEKINRLALQLGVKDVLDKKVGILSRGEQQRIAIIRALIQPFSWLLLDEPFSHLDEKNCEKAKEGITFECEERQAGLIITSLGKDNYFDYQQKVLM